MSLSINEIISLWRDEARRPGRTNHELDTTLRLPIVLGCTVDGLPYIMLLTERQPKTLNRLEAIDVRVSMRGNARPREKWALTFILQDWSLIHAFGEIVWLLRIALRMPLPRMRHCGKYTRQSINGRGC